MTEIATEKRQQVEMRLIVVLGIIQQLMTTRQGKLFAGRELTLAQFGVLVHFTHNPERHWTVTELADVMEMNQPGITKIVAVLLEKRWLESVPDKDDRRKRYLQITRQGLKLCQDTFSSLVPDIAYAFEDWDNDGLTQMQGHLERLMRWLDTHRDDIKRGNIQ